METAYKQLTESNEHEICQVAATLAPSLSMMRVCPALLGPYIGGDVSPFWGRACHVRHRYMHVGEGWKELLIADRTERWILPYRLEVFSLH